MHITRPARIDAAPGLPPAALSPVLNAEINKVCTSRIMSLCVQPEPLRPQSSYELGERHGGSWNNVEIIKKG